MYLCCLARWGALGGRRPPSPAPAPVRVLSGGGGYHPSEVLQLLQLPSYATLKYAIVSYSILGHSKQEGGWLPTLAGFTLSAIAGCHCLGAMAGCHCWVPLLGCHCWVPLLGAIAWVPLLGAIAGVPLGGCTRWRIGRGAVAGCHWIGCHCSVPLPDASYQL